MSVILRVLPVAAVVIAVFTAVITGCVPRKTPCLVDSSSTPATTIPAGASIQPHPASKYGVHLLLDDGVNQWPQKVWPQHVEYARRLVGEDGYVVELIRLDDLNVGRCQFFLDLCAQQHLIPILRLATTYDLANRWWTTPPKDASGGFTEVARRYRDFLEQLRWPTTPRYVIVGNEPNRGDEWSNQPDPGEYAQFLTDVSAALHSLGVTILAPALDMYAPNSNGQPIGGYRFIDAETFLDEMAAAKPGVFDAIDIWASHAYPMDPFRFDPSRQSFQIDYANGAINPRHTPPPPGIFNRGINSYQWDLWKVEQYIGDRAKSLPVMITETSWRHATSQGDLAGDASHADVSNELLGTYVDMAYRGNSARFLDQPAEGWVPWNDDPKVLAAVLFALDGHPGVWGHTNWVTLDADGKITGTLPMFQMQASISATKIVAGQALQQDSESED